MTAKLSTAHRVEQRDFDRPVFAEWECGIARAGQRPVIGRAFDGRGRGTCARPTRQHRGSHVRCAGEPARVLRTMDDVDPAFAAQAATAARFSALLVASRDDPYSTYEGIDRTRERARRDALVDAGDSGTSTPKATWSWPRG